MQHEFDLIDLLRLGGSLLVFVAVMIAYHNIPWARVWRAFMSTLAWFQERYTMRMEHGSYAVERRREPLGTAGAEPVPDLVERLSDLDDDTILGLLAQVQNEDGEYRYAESRIAKFIPGRVEERLAQVRAVRGTDKPLPPGRTLRVRDGGGERIIPFEVKR